MCAHKFLLLIFLCCLDTLSGQSQSRPLIIYGKVTDSLSGAPLAGASAFCPSTTLGTISNNEGYFTLRLPAGGYDLVASYTGYQRKIIRINSNTPPPDTLQISLSKEDNSMAEVAVVASTEVPDGLSKYGSFFLDHFIGTTPGARQCVLENPQALHFYYSKKRNRLKVMAREDLLISNYALGYKIRYQLDSFSYDYHSSISQYTGFPLFTEMDSSEEMKQQWQANRAATYLGSRLHFMRSLYDSTVVEDGFIVEKLDEPNGVKGRLIPNLYDSSLYQADSGDVSINWNGRYRISYTRLAPDSNFLRQFNLPARTPYQVTLVDVDDGFEIRENGYFFEQYDVVSTGYWAWKLLAEQLPYDYGYELPADGNIP